MLRAIVLLLVSACAASPRAEGPAAVEPESPAVPRAEPHATTASTSSSPVPGARDGCIVVVPGEDPVAVVVEGSLSRAPSDAAASSAPFVLRLVRARCVVGLPRAGYLAEVYVATTGVDLRPLLGTRVRLTGHAIGGATDLGTPAVIVLARDVERLPVPD